MEAENILKKTGIKNYEIDFVPLETLAEKLKSMKYGFVIREDTIVNRVATPTKFSNYLANGIIPIYSSCLKSFADFDKDNSLGVIFNGNIDNVIRHMQTELSAEEIYSKCKNAFNVYYNIERYIEKILNNDAFINLHIKEKL